MPKTLSTGEYWLMNWNPAMEPEHQDYFDWAADQILNGNVPDPIGWRVSRNTQLAGDPFLFKRGSQSRHPGIFATGTIVYDRDGDDGCDLQFDFIAPVGEEVSTDRLKQVDSDMLKLVASGCIVSAKSAKQIVKVLQENRGNKSKKQKPISENKEHREGAFQEIVLTRRERSKSARLECLEHFGDELCRVCGINFVEKFGEMGRILHVHHREDLALKSAGLVSGIDDLIPVCPNCHAMLHHTKPAMSTQKLKQLLKRKNSV
jgi:hypothetical protein